MKKIKKNMAKCAKCGDILQSKSRTNIEKCSCGAISISGGKFYLKRDYRDSADDLIEMTEYEE